MPEIFGEGTIVIDCSAQEIYSYISDLPRHAEWNHQPTEIVKTSDGPIDVGSTFRAKEQLQATAPWFLRAVAGLLGKIMPPTVTEAEITAMEPGRRLAWKARAPLPRRDGYGLKSEWELLLEPQGEATKLTQRFHYMPQTKLMDRMTNDGMARMQVREIAANLEVLKGMLEERMLDR